MRVPMHRHTSAELLFVLGGGGSLYGLEGEKKGTPLAAGSAVYIAAGTAHAFVQTGDEACTALQLYAPAGPEQRFKRTDAEGTTPVTDAEQKRPPRKFPRAKVRVARQAAELTIGNGKGSVRILFEEKNAGDAAASMGVMTARPGMAVADHNHPTSSEYLYILTGEGEMYVAGKAMTVHAGDAIQVPRGVAHSFVVKGDEPVKAVQFYLPAGPEQRFKPK
jgi:quercetin dioxygenase-like cupin family protein